MPDSISKLFGQLYSYFLKFLLKSSLFFYEACLLSINENYIKFNISFYKNYEINLDKMLLLTKLYLLNIGFYIF